MRDRMIEVIQDAVGGCATHWAELIADALIKYGATMPPNAIAAEYKITTVKAKVTYNPPLDMAGLGVAQMLERNVRRNLIRQMEDTLGSALVLTRRDEYKGGPFGQTIIRGEIAVAMPTGGEQ